MDHRKVLLLYTGGTIGMTRSPNGYAPQSGRFRAALDEISDRRCRNGS